MRSRISKIASTAALALAVAITLASCGKQVHVDGGKGHGRGNAKLLESITDYYGDVIEKFEYDKQNRLVKRIGYIYDEDGNVTGSSTTAITYSGNDLITAERIDSDNGKSVTKYAINGNTVTIEDNGGKDTLTIDEYGYATVSKGKYEYKDGKLISVRFPNDDACDGCEDIYTYTYDEMKSPFYNCATPKWLLQNLVVCDHVNASNNNLLSSSFDNGNEGGGRDFEYVYDSDLFPMICTTMYSGEGADDSPKEVTRYIYSGRTADEIAAFNAVMQVAKTERAERRAAEKAKAAADNADGGDVNPPESADDDDGSR